MRRRVGEGEVETAAEGEASERPRGMFATDEAAGGAEDQATGRRQGDAPLKVKSPEVKPTVPTSVM